MGKIVELMKCTNSFEAQVVKTHLEAEGIAAMVTDENMHTLYGGAVGAFAPRVLVDEDNLEAARTLLESDANSQQQQ